MKIVNSFIPVYLFILLCLSVSGCDYETTDPNPDRLSGAYFNKAMPSTTVTRFAPEIFTEELHAPPIFTPDGREVFWSLMDSPGILSRKIEEGFWSETGLASFSLGGGDDSPFISSDGNVLVFQSGYNSSMENIWMVEKSSDGWGSPWKLGENVNQYASHWQASISDNGNLYFSAERIIYFSEFKDGSYTPAQILDSTANVDGNYRGSPFIAPDESYMIFDCANPYADLYIRFKQEDGTWGEAINMTELNTEYHELYANVSPDGRFLMFLSGRARGILLPYWVDASIIENYKPATHY